MAGRADAPLRGGGQEDLHRVPGLGHDKEGVRTASILEIDAEPARVVLRLVPSTAAPVPAPGGGQEFFRGENLSQ